MYLQIDIQNLNISIAIICAIVVFIIVLLLFFVITYRNSRNLFIKEKELMQIEFDKSLLQAQIETQEETLSALGKELHDNIGQLLNSTKLLIGITQRKLSQSPDTLAIADQTLATAIHELRSLSKSLNKEWLQQFDFIENLTTEIKRINASDDLVIHLEPTTKLPFKSNEQIMLFRIVQEALQNAIKHATCKNIYISCIENNHVLDITIQDDGSGFSNQTSTGVGIINMQSRIQLLGGNINWQSNLNGTIVTIQLPIKQNNE